MVKRSVFSGMALLAFALLAIPAPSQGAGVKRLVINHSMAGIRPGDDVERLHRHLGKPKGIRYLQNEITGSMRADYYGKLAFYSHGGTILSMKTTRRSMRSRSGIHVGMTTRKLRRKLPGLSCYMPMCRIVAGGGSATIGRRVTSFRIRDGRVRFITIGNVID